MTLPKGLSAQAIDGSGNNHPWDPADLLRCVRYMDGRGLTTDRLRTRMAGRSVSWDRLLPEWDSLVELLFHEMQTRTDGTAPRTYSEMKRVLADGITCDSCSGTGRGPECAKCRGTGFRSGGRCRAKPCFNGADLCGACGGRGYVAKRSGK